VFHSFQVCELDIIFNFEKAHYVLDEFIIGGEVQESSQKSVIAAIAQQDILQEVGFISVMIIGEAWHGGAHI